MSADQAGTDTLQPLLDRLAAGDEAAADQLIERSVTRLDRLARTMLNDYPRLRRWYETGDVAQAAAVRLVRALRALKPASPKEFMSLAALQIRRELRDLTRHEFGAEGAGAHHHTDRPGAQLDEAQGLVQDPTDDTAGPATRARWADLLRFVEESLPQDEREVFDLLHVQGLGQEEAADILGVSVPTVKRRWRSARLLLHAQGLFEGTAEE